MKTPQTFGITFFLKSSREKNGKSPIYARITVDGQRADLSTKMEVSIENWSQEKGMVKGNKDEIRSLKKYLEGFRARIVESFQDLQLQKVAITAQSIKEAVTGQKSTPSRTLVGLIQYHNTRMKDSLEPGTMKNYFTTQRYLQRFLTEQLKIKDIPLSELTYSFLLDFEQFIKRAPDRTHRYSCSQNGAMKHIERIKKMIRLAMDHEWLEKDPFQKFKLQFRKTTREFLTPSELATIESKPIQIPRLRQVRDLFIFSCYSGLAYIDVMQLTSDNIALGIDGEPWLHIRRQKSDEPMSIPLLPPAIKLIQLYQSAQHPLKEKTIFPRISNQKLNGYLKEIADVCGIRKNLTFHMARHTFATTVTLTNGVPIETVSKLLGHANLRTTQVYAKVVQLKVSQDMKQLKQRLGESHPSFSDQTLPVNKGCNNFSSDN